MCPNEPPRSGESPKSARPTSYTVTNLYANTEAEAQAVRDLLSGKRDNGWVGPPASAIEALACPPTLAIRLACPARLVGYHQWLLSELVEMSDVRPWCKTLESPSHALAKKAGQKEPDPALTKKLALVGLAYLITSDKKVTPAPGSINASDSPPTVTMPSGFKLTIPIPVREIEDLGRSLISENSNQGKLRRTVILDPCGDEVRMMIEAVQAFSPGVGSLVDLPVFQDDGEKCVVTHSKWNTVDAAMFEAIGRTMASFLDTFISLNRLTKKDKAALRKKFYTAFKSLPRKLLVLATNKSRRDRFLLYLDGILRGECEWHSQEIRMARPGNADAGVRCGQA